MKKMKSIRTCLLFVAIIGVLSIAGCALGDRDMDPPQVIATVPIDATEDVALNGTINMTFSEAMDPETIVAANYSVVHGATPVAGVVSYDASTFTAIFKPTGNLLASTDYTATITTGVEDASGNALATNKVWDFTTGLAVDNTPPTVVSVVPIHTATGVAVTSVIIARFSEGMDTATINAVNFTVAGAGAVTGTVTYDVGNKNAIFSPSVNLAVNTLYTATIRTGVKDLAGNALASDEVWTFTTITAAGDGPAPVNLRTAGNFAILAKTGISTVPDSIITGDIGVSPAAETYMTGFSQTDTATAYSLSDQVTGFMYAASMAAPTPSNMTTAIANMQTAYTDAAGRPAGTGPNLNLGGGTLNGVTLSPGTYTWGTGVSIMGSDINISGDANDVWIFQIAGTLNLSNGIHVHLAGAAQAKNIFWQVSGAVTLGTTSIFEGTILGQTGITLQTGATVHGRVLAQTLVALQVATVTKPAP